MGVETERKFLVNKGQWTHLLKPAPIRITQGYLVASAGITVRVRIADDKAFITIKGKTAGTSRSEFEYEVPVEDGRQMLAEFAQSQLSKKRYRIDYRGKTWEVDEFTGDNDGLLLAEIELDNDKEQFDTPAWIGKEVSDDVRYYNSYLAKHNFKTWK